MSGEENLEEAKEEIPEGAVVIDTSAAGGLTFRVEGGGTVFMSSDDGRGLARTILNAADAVDGIAVPDKVRTTVGFCPSGHVVVGLAGVTAHFDDADAEEFANQILDVVARFQAAEGGEELS